MDVDNKQVGQRIKSIRLNLGLTAEQFGEKIDKNSPASQSLVSRWERGINLPNRDRLKSIAKEAEISVNELLYGSPDKFIETVLIDDIKNKGRLYVVIKDYLTRTTELYKDKESVFEPQDDLPEFVKQFNDLANTEKLLIVLDYLQENMNEFITIIKNDKTFSLDKNKVIELAIEHVNRKYYNDMSTFKGQYFSFKEVLSYISSYSSLADIETIKTTYIHAYNISENEAYIMALDSIYRNKLSKHSVEFENKIDKLNLEYENMLKEYK